MPTTARIFLACGAGSAMLAVILGAFGAHALQGRLAPHLLDVYHTAAQYQFYHALGLLAIGILAARPDCFPCLRLAGWCMIVGTILFSGSLYVLSLTGIRIFGAITPLGGVAFIAGWISLLVGVLRA
jgi:uncharacterized membrane protein YgdD (TMEM256/DUF423 family)